jgi:hypothetical protein
MDANGHRPCTHVWHLTVGWNTFFVVNDTKVGATERSKYHWRTSKDVCKNSHSEMVFVIEPASRALPVKTKEFFDAISNPPSSRILAASSLIEKPRKDASVGKNVTILKLERKGANSNYYNRSDSNEMVWRDAGKADEFDSNTTYYYLPLSGFFLESKFGYNSGKELYDQVEGSGLNLQVSTVYGVRKSDIEYIKTQKNWVNYETHILDKLNKITEADLITLAVGSLDNFEQLQYNNNIMKLITNSDSPFAVVMAKFKGVKKTRYSKHDLECLVSHFSSGKSLSVNPEEMIKKVYAECHAVYARYPLLENLRYRDHNNAALAEYINLVDTAKGIV